MEYTQVEILLQQLKPLASEFAELSLNSSVH